MSRTKKFLYNSASTALLHVITMLVGFITPIVMLQAYGSEINGLVLSIAQFISYFNLVEAGISGAAIYALYKPLADNDHKEISSIVSVAKEFYTQSGYVFVLLIIGLSIIYPVVVQTDAASPISIGCLVLILGVNGALEFFTLSKYRVLLSADQRAYVISIASIIHIVVNTIIIVVLAKLRVNVVFLRFVALISIFLRSFILMIYVKINYKYINYKEKPNKNALNKRWDALYLQILGAIHTGTPIVLITLLINDLKVVSVYTVFNMVLSGLNGLLGIFKSGLSASFGDVIAKNEKKILQKSYKEFEFVYYSLITLIFSVTFIMIMPFIKIYTKGINDTNYILPSIGFLITLNGLLYNIKIPQGMLVISAGLYKETKLQTTYQGIIAVACGAVLAPIWGLKGILIGSILSDIYRDIDLIFFIPHKVTKLLVRESLFRIVRVLGNTLIITMPFLFFRLNPTNYFSWFLNATFVGIYAFIVVILSGYLFDKEDMIGITNRLKSIVGVKK